MKTEKLGYQQSFLRKILSLFVKFLRNVLLLNFNNTYSNEFIQNLDPKSHIFFEGQKIYFRTGHNRLNWRVKTFHTEEPIMTDWLKSFNDKDIFLDIGANVGIYTLPALKQGSLVIASEMDPKNVALLFENVYLNKLFEKFILLPFGVFNKKSIEKIYYRDFSLGDALQSIGRENPIPTTKTNSFEAKQILFPLDELFRDFKLPNPNKIKIDVDGNEEFVFESGKNIIFSASEVYFEDNGIDKNKKIIELFHSNNFYIDREETSNRKTKNLNMRNLLFKKFQK